MLCSCFPLVARADYRALASEAQRREMRGRRGFRLGFDSAVMRDEFLAERGKRRAPTLSAARLAATSGRSNVSFSSATSCHARR
jgi:hypothetical protein